MILVPPKAESLKLRRTFLFIIQLGILLMVSCHSEQEEKNGDTGTNIQQLRRQLTDLKYREQALQRENILARKPELYLVVSHTDLECLRVFCFVFARAGKHGL